jgi:hypothetical protein
MSALYSATLLEHPNSKRHVIIVLLPCGSMRRQLAPAPSLFLEPSKYKVQMNGSISSKEKLLELGTKYVQLLVSTFVQSSTILQWGSTL